MWWINYGLLSIASLLIMSLGIIAWRLREDNRRLQHRLESRNHQLEKQKVEFSQRTVYYSRDLQQAQESAEKAHRTKNQFLSKISHELRNPLYTILGYTQLLDRHVLSQGVVKESIGQIRYSGEHLLSLINDVVEIVQLEDNQLQLNPTTFNLRRFLSAIEATIQPQALSKGLQLIFYIPSEAPVNITTDENKLRQIIINLLDNAIKYTENGSIILRIGVADKAWLSSEVIETDINNSIVLFFEVEDTGVGIEAQVLEKIFDPFFNIQFDQGQKGMGLELAISKKLINLMGGNISISSTLEEGTLVKFSTLVKGAELDTWEGILQGGGRIIGLAGNQPRYRILVVDDRKENRNLLVKLLAPLGFEIREAQNGQEAIRLWSTWQPHLIWMDTKIPFHEGIDSQEAIRRIRQLETLQVAPAPVQRTIIIGLVASNLDQETQNYVVGYDGLLRKPFEIDMILEKMAQYLNVRYVYETQSIPEDPASEDNLSTIPLNDLPLSGGDPDSNISLLARSSRLMMKGVQVKSLRVMPIEWLRKVHDSANAGDSQELYDLLEQIPDIDNSLNTFFKSFGCSI
ncbi:MAG: Sensor histidine kinase RcsC [Chroococcopsis gigantea SAG 12.99]|nr:Sensor histidine kinase RcsC [Chroococcopsis gigantea SAG 12.99]